ncbi:MAG: DUF4405 domain-containing protein [Anaerolineales bacterium]|nr:DUF4405 domain-containing protein [Anaerolineales bacterium]
MDKKQIFSVQTRNHLILDVFLVVAGLVTALSGIYFLFLPVGGFQGGRNPLYGIIIFFERHTWSDIHIWASVLIMALAALHIPLHWKWIVSMTKNGLRSMFGKNKLNKYSQFNLMINIIVGLSGLICGISGLYFLLIPGASHESLVGDPGLIFSRLTWDLIHTWSGVVMIAAAVLHLGIHWNWVLKIVKKYWKTFVEKIYEQRLDQPVLEPSVRIKN